MTGAVWIASGSVRMALFGERIHLTPARAGPAYTVGPPVFATPDLG